MDLLRVKPAWTSRIELRDYSTALCQSYTLPGAFEGLPDSLTNVAQIAWPIASSWALPVGANPYLGQSSGSRPVISGYEVFRQMANALASFMLSSNTSYPTILAVPSLSI
jgi:hypothetical protein